MTIAIALGLAVSATAIAAQGPEGPLAGTHLDAGQGSPMVLIVPGSGPTDRDGNNPLGVTAAPYRLLAEALAGKGVSSVRIDKRGMFASKTAIADANAVTIGDYASDVQSWISAIRDRTSAPCVWVLGHSEGALVALAAGKKGGKICGLILVSAPGRKLADVMREQLRANPANAPLLDDALRAIAELEGGRTVDVSAMAQPLQGLFAPAVQPFLIDLFSQDPAADIAALDLPLLIVGGTRDIQTPADDSRALARANPAARLVVVDGMNHVLKPVEGDDRAANLAVYADPSIPVSPGLVDAIAAFVRR